MLPEMCNHLVLSFQWCKMICYAKVDVIQVPVDAFGELLNNALQDQLTVESVAFFVYVTRVNCSLAMRKGQPHSQ